jgi:hypothetical protein
MEQISNFHSLLFDYCDGDTDNCFLIRFRYITNFNCYSDMQADFISNVKSMLLMPQLRHRELTRKVRERTAMQTTYHHEAHLSKPFRFSNCLAI